MKANQNKHLIPSNGRCSVLYYKYNSLNSRIWLFLVIFLLKVLFSPNLIAQVTDSLLLEETKDSITMDSISVDSLDIAPAPDTLAYQISPDSLDAPVYFDARDSIEYDLKNKKIYLFGAAKVKYTSISLEAGYIVLDWEKNILTADFVLDSLGKPIEKPKFADGSQEFTANKLRYNFKTKKGQIIDARTFENNLHVLSEKAKFFAQDSTHARDYVFGQNAIFTTCDADHPHYGIKSKKQKVVPKKLIVVGPSNLEIMDVPTPLFLPFGFFPIFEKRHAGLIFPQDFENSPQLGFGLRNVGYYFPLGPNYDLKLTGDIYMKGSWGVQAAMKYKKRYKYNGEFTIAMSTIKTELKGELTPQISRPKKLIWEHRQDNQAHPYNSFSAKVNIESDKFEKTTLNRADNVLENSYESRVTFRRKFPSSPFSITASLGHSQIIKTGEVVLNLPTLDLRMRQIYPFKRKQGLGKERWYEQFSLTYSAQTKNIIRTSDSTLFDKSTWRNLNLGAKHNLSSSASYRILKYFNFSPSINYQELWYLKGDDYNFDNNLLIEPDTLFNEDGSVSNIMSDTVGFGSVDTIPFTGFRSIRTFNVGASLNTKVFGTLLFKKGFLRGIRHTISPSIGFNFTPDYTKSPFNYYQNIQTDTRQAPDEYSLRYRYANGIYGRPLSSGKQMAINYSLGHIFEAKYFARKDSTVKRTRLFDNINMGGSYNFAADSMRWSKVSITGGSKLFRKMTTFRISATFDPYAVNEEGKAINQFYWNTNHKLLRFVRMNMSFSTSFSIQQIADALTGKKEDKSNKKTTKKGPQKERLLDWFSGFRISHNLTYEFLKEADKLKGKIRTNSINTRGRIPLTNNWNLNVGNIGYDFANKRMTYPDFGFSRDLHCWNMGVNWQPQRGTYSFFLKVTSQPLDFLKLPYNRNQFDAQRVAF